MPERHGFNFGNTWPANDPVAGRGGTDVMLSNVNAPMEVYRVMERAFCTCDPDAGLDTCGWDAME